MIHEIFILPFTEFAFMRRALVGCMALSLAAAPVGVFLLLRRMALVGDAMAHAVLPGAAIGFFIAGLSLFAMTLGGLLAGLSVAILAGLVARFTSLKEDASLATFYLISLALGVLLISARGTNVDLMHVLFGTVLALDDAALLLIASIASISAVTMAVIYRPLVLECFDPGFLRSVRGHGGVYHLIFLGLVVLCLIGGFHALGTLLAVGMIILPAAAAQFWARDITPMIGIAWLIGVTASLCGLLLSYHANLASGPAIILVAGLLYMGSVILGPRGSLRARYAHGSHTTG